MNFATTKERILQYLEIKEVSLKTFFNETGIKRGFLDSDKLKSSVSDVFITIIIAKYSDINLDWLLTGKGEMLKQNQLNEIGIKVPAPNENIELVALQKETIAILKREVEDLREDKYFLKNVIDKKLGKEKSA